MAKLTTPSNGLIMPERAVLSLFDKTGGVEVAQELFQRKVELLSTWWTSKVLTEAGLPVKDIANLTGFPEMMDGRVKTLHPAVHGWLLANLEDEAHVAKMVEHNIQRIDMLLVNLYPFEEAYCQLKEAWLTHAEIIEKIDIWGPAMLRSTAKNYNRTTAIIDPADYERLYDELEKNDWRISFEFREYLAGKVFNYTAYYDAVIWKYFQEITGEKYHHIALPFQLVQKARYGENPHQQAAIYREWGPSSGRSILDAKQVNGKEMSSNNFGDADRALQLVQDFTEPTCAVIKHNNSCGLASCGSIEDAFDTAFKCDEKSAFGGIVVVNKEINLELAKKLEPIFWEVIVAPSITPEAQELLSKKEALRTLIWESLFEWESSVEEMDMKGIRGWMILQDRDEVIVEQWDIEYVTSHRPTPSQMEDLLFAHKAVKHTTSNAIVVAQGKKTVGVGMGQTSRIDSLEIACERALAKCEDKDSNVDKDNLVMASDAFFPFADNIEAAHEAGIKAIIVTRGSKRDEEVVDKAEELGIALCFIKTRHFKH